MQAPLPNASKSAEAQPPEGLRVLCVTSSLGVAAPLAESLNGLGEGSVRLAAVAGGADAMDRLANAPFDAVVVHHHPGRLSAVDFVRALRAGGHDHPAIVLANAPPAELEEPAYRAGADGYCCLAHATPRLLLCLLRRAVSQARLRAEHRRLAGAEHRRLADEHREAERLLTEQRRLVTQLELLGESPADTLGGLGGKGPAHAAGADRAGPSRPFPAETPRAYRELLEAYVVMGAGRLAGEMSKLAGKLIDQGVTGREAIELHVAVLEELVAGLGARSARHVINRADLLVLELLVNLADGYRRRYDSDEVCPAPSRNPAA